MTTAFLDPQALVPVPCRLEALSSSFQAPSSPNTLISFTTEPVQLPEPLESHPIEGPTKDRTLA